MSHYRAHSQGKVPFSWENKPGISKVLIHHEFPKESRACGVKLPPPPCPSESTKVVLGQDLQIPLPPCPFLQFPSRSSSRNGLRQKEDPFLAAYKECTKSNGSKRSGGGSGVLMTMYMFSCKHSCGVRDDGLLRFSHLPPIPRDKHKKEFKSFRPQEAKDITMEKGFQLAP
ncbi:uncharacterized protein LOC122085636 [Macadamia integrifolia]|uniref:uncharacterized protein LOC122085636 n=1 Tax=Macadamia integrifolia TaxID=60698 RepID=UPI001C4E5DB5|nr:uncharacterized protein LOC122085636 [Macadamia integrifolia]